MRSLLKRRRRLKMDKKKRPMFVSTDQDLWNSADDAHFFVINGSVKPLPEETTPIIEDALDQGLLREATPEEMSKYHFEEGMKSALSKRLFSVGKDYKATLKNYEKYLEDKKMAEEEAKVEEVPKEEVKEEEKEEPKEEEKKEVKVKEESKAE